MLKKNTPIIVAVIVLTLTVSALAFYFFISQPRSSHQKVIASITIKDISKGWTLKPEFVKTQELQWLSAFPIDNVDFRTKNSYTQSLWVWKNPSGDIDYAATIWGPDETGNGYYVELARLCGREIKITCTKGVITFSAVSDWSNLKQEGYTVLQVKVN